MAIEKKFTSDCSGKTLWVQRFESINEFAKFIEETPINDAFKKRRLSSSASGSINWYGTYTIEEAFELLRNGWTAEAQKLTKALRAKTKSIDSKKQMKQIKSVAGYQPIVPNYLANNPQNMVSSRFQVKKQKVLTIVRQGNFLADVTSEQIEKEALKALAIVSKIEAQGYRCNLYLAYCSETMHGDKATLLLVKIKGAGEKLNVSKIAFPFCNTAMFRRLVFAWRERYEHTPYDFRYGYGRTVTLSEILSIFGQQGAFPKNSYGINNFIKFDVESFDNFEEMLVKLG